MPRLIPRLAVLGLGTGSAFWAFFCAGQMRVPHRVNLGSSGLRGSLKYSLYFSSAPKQ
jgi:hypothetical protein